MRVPAQVDRVLACVIAEALQNLVVCGFAETGRLDGFQQVAQVVSWRAVEGEHTRRNLHAGRQGLEPGSISSLKLVQSKSVRCAKALRRKLQQLALVVAADGDDPQAWPSGGRTSHVGRRRLMRYRRD
jgi:hypothetical protein